MLCLFHNVDISARLILGWSFCISGLPWRCWVGFDHLSGTLSGTYMYTSYYWRNQGGKWLNRPDLNNPFMQQSISIIFLIWPALASALSFLTYLFLFVGHRNSIMYREAVLHWMPFLIGCDRPGAIHDWMSIHRPNHFRRLRCIWRR